MPLSRVLLAILLLCGSVAAAQTAVQSGPATATPSTSGAVVLGRVTEGPRGSGVAEATVRLYPRQGGKIASVITDARGQFVFFNVADGAYSLEASRPGYFFGTYGQAELGDRGREFVVSGGRAPTSTVVPVWKGGDVTGTVMDETGTPMPGWTVLRMAPLVRGGRLQWITQSEQALTDDRGTYSLSNVYPGPYMLVFRPPAAVIEKNGARVVYPTVAYPSARSLAGASPVTVEAGSMLSGLNLSARPLDGFRISGQVNGASGSAAIVRLSVWDDDPDGELEVAVVNSARAGSFNFDGVPAGTYRVSIWPGAARPTFAAVDSAGNTLPAPSVPRQPADAFARVVVSQGNVSDVVVTPQPQAMVSGRVIFKGETAPTTQIARSVGIVISSPSGATFFPSSPDAAGSFSASVSPGAYFVRPVAPPAGWTVESITASGRSLIDTPVTVEAPGVEVVITFTDRLSEVSGTVRRSDGGPLPNDREVSVMLFPADPALWVDNGASSLRIRTVRVAPDGAFVTRALLPGEYLAVAAATADTRSTWPLATTLERLARVASRVRVSGAEKVTLDLRALTGFPK